MEDERSVRFPAGGKKISKGAAGGGPRLRAGPSWGRGGYVVIPVVVGGYGVGNIPGVRITGSCLLDSAGSNLFS